MAGLLKAIPNITFVYPGILSIKLQELQASLSMNLASWDTKYPFRDIPSMNFVCA